MLPAGKYVVEVIVPPGYELVKEEDKNILLGDVYIAPISIQFAGLGNIFIMPDQAAINAFYNKNNAINPTSNLGAGPRHEGDTAASRPSGPASVPSASSDFNSLFPIPRGRKSAPFRRCGRCATARKSRSNRPG